ncbi:MAG TPA: hypothetical protein VFY85_15475 [Gemmatimonadaceae bacterium]|nr:hypothetical protein [Gemmatimonadaceae bacterium]
MRCLGRILVLALVLIAAVVLWVTRDRWLRYLPGSHGATTVAERTWEPLSPEAASRGKKAIDALSARSGPVFTNLKGAEVASYVFERAGASLPPASDSAEAAVIGDVLYVRAIVPMKAVAGSGALGPLGGLLNDREPLTLGGTFRVIKPGLSEFRIREVKLRDFRVPTQIIPRLVKQLDRGTRPDGVSPDAIAVKTPPTLADVRIANNRVTLYKTLPPSAGGTAQ